MTETTNVNGKVYTASYDAATRKGTATSPLGRKAYLWYDSKGRVTKQEIPGLEPVNIQYDADGRVEYVTQGAGAERVYHIEYDQKGEVEFITDPLNQKEGYEYDNPGRVTRQVLPDLHRHPLP